MAQRLALQPHKAVHKLQPGIICGALPYPHTAHQHAPPHHAGNVSDNAKQLCEVTKLALDEAIKVCGPGVPYSEIGKVIHGIADKHKYGVVRDFVGHGVGQLFHSAPTIVHYRNNYPGVMQVRRAAWHQCPWHHAVTDDVMLMISAVMDAE